MHQACPAALLLALDSRVCRLKINSYVSGQEDSAAEASLDQMKGEKAMSTILLKPYVSERTFNGPNLTTLNIARLRRNQQEVF